MPRVFFFFLSFPKDGGEESHKLVKRKLNGEVLIRLAALCPSKTFYRLSEDVYVDDLNTREEDEVPKGEGKKRQWVKVEKRERKV